MTEHISPWARFGGVLIPDWLFRRRELTANAKMLYARMARYTAGGKLNCWPSQEELAEDMNLAPRTVRALIAELVEVGLIETERVGLGQPNRYWFLRHAWMDAADAGEPAFHMDDRGEFEDVVPDRQELPTNTVNTSWGGRSERHGYDGHSPSLKEVVKELPPADAGVTTYRPERPTNKKRSGRFGFIEETDESPVLGTAPKTEPETRQGSAAGLASRFDKRAHEYLSDLQPVDLSPRKLAWVIKSWLKSGWTPETVAEVIDRYFDSSPRPGDQPLWRHFLVTAPDLYKRAADRIDSQSDDYWTRGL